MLQIKTEIKPKSYPYLAVETFNEEIINGKVYYPKDIIVISLVEDDSSDRRVYGQPLMGGKTAWQIYDERNYRPLPSNYVLTLKNDDNGI